MKRLKCFFLGHDYTTVVTGYQREMKRFKIYSHCSKCGASSWAFLNASVHGLEVWDELRPSEFMGKWTWTEGQSTEQNKT